MCKIIVVLPMLIALMACSSAFEIVEIPRHEADLYPHSESKQNVTVAIDEISSKDRVVSYFGADLTKNGILPVNIIISNNGSQRFELRPSDILLRRGSLTIGFPYRKYQLAGKYVLSFSSEAVAENRDFVCRRSPSANCISELP